MGKVPRDPQTRFLGNGSMRAEIGDMRSIKPSRMRRGFLCSRVRFSMERCHRDCWHCASGSIMGRDVFGRG